MTTIDGALARRNAPIRATVPPTRHAAMSRAVAEFGRAAGAIAIFTAVMAIVIGFHAARTLPSFHSGGAVLSALLDRLF